MIFYYFGGSLHDKNQMTYLDDLGFKGVLFTYVPHQGDVFTWMVDNIDKSKKIKYLIAIRPHTISPQYLSMIAHSMDKIAPGRLQVNLIAGHIKPDEVDFGGILGEVNDKSSVKDRVNYMIEYLDVLNLMDTKLDFYVSCTNPYAFNAAASHNNKIILPYRDYKKGYFDFRKDDGQIVPGQKLDIKDKNIMLAVSPIIRNTQEEIDSQFPKNISLRNYYGTEYLDRKRFTADTEYFTYEDFGVFIKKLESEGIKEVLFNSYSEEERSKLIYFTAKYMKENS